MKRSPGRILTAVLPVLVLSGLVASAGGAQEAWAQDGDFETTRIGDGVYQFRAATHLTPFVVTDDGLVAFDPISNEAASRYTEEMRRVAPGAPLRAIVYSHHHADHATGARVLRQAFGEDVPVVAHRNALDPLEEAGDPDLPPPDVTFTDGMSLHLGDRTVELHHLGPSHSDNLIVALIPHERLVFAVDFVANDGVGFRELGGFHFPEQIQAVERLLELDFERIAFGHDPPGDRATIERQLQYYRDLVEAVQEALERGWSEDRAAEEIRLPRYEEWREYEEWFPLNVRGVYRALSER